MADEAKTCTVCGKELPLEAFAYSRANRAKYDRRGDCKECHNTKARERRKRDPQRWEEVRRDCYLRWTFGITRDEYDKMFSRQNGTCAICRQPETVKRAGKLIHLAVDHDHKTGKVRELVCGKCNKALGFLDEDEDRCRSMIAYIQKHNQ